MGLLKAVRVVFPQAEQRECFRHLMQNFIKKNSGESVGHMWPAARAYDKDYEKHMAAVYAANPDAKQWLQKNQNQKWQRSDFNPDVKCDYVTNNIAEVFNNWIADIRDLPVVELVDKIREMIIVLFHKRRQIGARLYGRILPAVLPVLRARTRGLGHLTVIQGDNYAAEVWDNCNHRFVVKAYRHECTCLEWQHTGKPYQHALSLITAQQIRNVMMEDFVHDYYSVEKFRKAYARLIEALPDKEKWPNVDLPFEVCAPLTKRAVGRQGKIGTKVVLKVGVVDQNLQKLLKMKMRRPRNKLKAKCSVLIVETMDTGKLATNVHLMELKKGNESQEKIQLKVGLLKNYHKIALSTQGNK